MFLFLGCIKIGFEINQPENVWNENLKNVPPHISCHLPFKNDSLPKC
jgi:hypothetical protein